MADAVPIWVAKYIGIQFKERGRSLEGCDCWGLLRVVWQQQFGITFRSMSEGYKDTTDLKSINKLYDEERTSDEWVKVKPGKEQLGDCVVFRIRGVASHVGMVIVPGKMLHIEKGANSCYVPYNNLSWKNRIEAFYRPRALQVHGTKY